MDFHRAMEIQYPSGGAGESECYAHDPFVWTM